jgi:hypothetical protein
LNQATIKNMLYRWLKRVLGTRQVFTLTFNSDFVTGNVIACTVGVQSFSIPFDTDHATTLEKLRRFLQATDLIFKCLKTGNRQLTCTTLNPGVSLAILPTVTGGASQPVCTNAQTIVPVDTTVVFAEQLSAIKPPEYPFATIRIDSIVRYGIDELRNWDDDTGVAEIGGLRRCTVEINYFGDNSFTFMSDVANSLDSPRTIEFFHSNQCAIGEKMTIQNLTGVLESKFEERSFFDFYLLYADNYEDEIEVIESAEISGEIDGTAEDPMEIGPFIVQV